MAKWELKNIEPRNQKDTMVSSPDHYQNSRIECIDAMAAMAEETVLQAHAAHLWQTAFKYLWRFPTKHKFAAGQIQDLKKCRWYIDRLIQEVED